MLSKIASLALLVGLLAPAVFGPSPDSQSDTPVQPARVVRMRNFDLDASSSNRPTYLPREWGRLVSVQPMPTGNVWLFLQNDDGAIYVVLLVQRGNYLYLDTTDRGGTVLVVPRVP